ncbi:MAG: hypothetical protein KC486_35875, partial [Myxococcales bacterium]|nr:hypothetical protein [Myxococcales bacterium]
MDAPANVRAQLDKQRARLEEALSPADFDEIQGVSPRQSWVPVDLVARWLSAMEGLARPLPLVRRRGLVQLAGTSYTRIKAAGISERVTLAIGWL